MNFALGCLGRLALLLAAVLAVAVVGVLVPMGQIVLDDPLLWDGGGGVESLGLAAGVIGGGSVWMGLLALISLSGAVFGGIRPWISCLTLHLPGWTGLGLAAAAAAAVHYYLPHEGTAVVAVTAVVFAVPSSCLLFGGHLLWWRARRIKRARARA